jgi:two-component system cell cycle sensor histidine kinase/response regulator CckA
MLNQYSGLVKTLASDLSTPECLDWRMRAIEAAGEGIVITDPRLPDNPIIYVNEGFRRITGYANDEVLGRNCRFMRGSETSLATNAEMRSRLAAAQPFSCEIINYRKNQEPFWNRLYITPVFDESQTLTHFVGVQLDVTEFKAAEEVAERARAQLASTARFEALAQLSSGLAHEINNPTTGMLLLCERMRRFLDGWKDKSPTLDELSTAAGTLARIEGLCARVSAVVSGMQGFTALPRTTDSQKVPVGEVLDAALAQLHDSISTARMSVKVTGDGEVLVVTENHLLVQAVAALIRNSIDATESHAVKQLLIDITPRQDLLLLRFSDSAPVLSQQHAGQLFMPFFTTKEQGKGTGLGLYVARNLCERIGAKISYDREKEKNVFVIELPLAREDAKANSTE